MLPLQNIIRIALWKYLFFFHWLSRNLLYSSLTSLNSLKIHQVKILSLTNISQWKDRICSCNMFGWGFLFSRLWLVGWSISALFFGGHFLQCCLFLCLFSCLVDCFWLWFLALFCIYKSLKNTKVPGSQILKSFLLMWVLPVTPPGSVFHPCTQIKSQ